VQQAQVLAEIRVDMVKSSTEFLFPHVREARLTVLSSLPANLGLVNRQAGKPARTCLLQAGAKPKNVGGNFMTTVQLNNFVA